jgi:hypothetical protein
VSSEASCSSACLQLSDCALLLVAIASRSNGCIDQKYTDIEEAMVLIQENEDLQVTLADTFKAKSFRSIRNLSTNPHRQLSLC